MDITQLKQTVSQLLNPTKGILAADESSKTIQKRFDKIGLESIPDNDLAFRKMLFSTPGVDEFLSGVILFDETIRQAIDGVNIPQYLERRGILPGIKVDKGAVEMPNSPLEKLAVGLDKLEKRLTEYKSMGAKFAKFRATIQIGEYIPTEECIEKNAQTLARYAILCQNQDLVPIVEAEVLLDGDHTIERCKEVQIKTLKTVFAKLTEQNVILAGMILKPSMVLSGKDSPTQADSKTVAKMTIEALEASVPKEVGGIAFLSGGQTPDKATVNLAEINRIGGPWVLTFSFSRALEKEPLAVWGGKAENIKKAQEIFYQRCQKVSLARQGKLH